MAYYTISSGSYSDYRIRAILIGPEGVDIEKLRAWWVEHGPLKPGVEPMDAFTSYLSGLPGWEEVFPTEFRIGDNSELNGWWDYENESTWPPKPSQGDEPCPKWPFKEGRYFENHPSHHSWEIGRDESGRKYWGCCWCGKEATDGETT